MIKSKIKYKKIHIIVIIHLTVLFVLASCQHSKKPKANSNIPPAFVSKEPVFVKQGELYFLSDKKDTITILNIQIADNRTKRAKGLMHHKKLKENNGMLFVFDSEERQSFWMKNTHIPLDIIFVNENKEIVDIAPNNKPYSLRKITSLEYSKYVIETNAGYCKRHKIEVGMLVNY